MRAACPTAKAMMNRRAPVRGKNEVDRLALPALPSPPRPIRLTATGVVVVAACAVLIVGGLYAAVVLYDRARTSAHQVALFASDAVATEARVFRVQHRGSGGDRRTIVHYEYTVDGGRFRDSAELRRRDRDAYSVESHIAIRYLSADPSASWIAGR